MIRREFFVNAASLLLLGFGRENGMLAEGTQAPDFTADGLSLRQFRGRNRVVVVFTPSERYLKGLTASAPEYEDRDLVVLAFVPADTPAGVGLPRFVSVLTNRAQVSAPYHDDGWGTVFYLIGKDGHIALARHGIPSDKELFALIDAMPMRRREMREQGR